MVLIALCKFSADEDRETTEDEGDGVTPLEIMNRSEGMDEEESTLPLVVNKDNDTTEDNDSLLLVTSKEDDIEDDTSAVLVEASTDDMNGEADAILVEDFTDDSELVEDFDVVVEDVVIEGLTVDKIVEWLLTPLYEETVDAAALETDGETLLSTADLEIGFLRILTDYGVRVRISLLASRG